MKKRLTALFTAVVMVIFAAAPVFAAEGDEAVDTAVSLHHVIDADGVLSQDEQSAIEAKAEAVYEANGVDLFVYVSGEMIASPQNMGYQTYRRDACTDASVIMLRDSENSYIYAYGRAEAMFTQDDLDGILDKADAEGSTADAALAFLKATGRKLTANGVLPIPEEKQLGRLVDDADLLTDSQEELLLEKLNTISENRQLDVVIVTKYSLDGKSSEAYADDFYDYNGYGYGADDDGILLLIGMEDRDWAITTYGKGIQAFTDEGQSYISNQFVSYLSNGEYYRGFVKFADLCDEFAEYYDRTGTAYDVNNLPKEPFPTAIFLIGSLLIGLIAGLITVTSMKGSLKSVRPQAAATAYTKAGSLKITQRNDLFLYNVVNRTARPRDEGSGGGGNHSGGSSTHHSSSGRSHGGSHGHF